MRIAFNFNGPNKLKKIIFKNIVPMKVSAVFECNSNNSYSADNNQILSKMLVKIAGQLARQGRKLHETLTKNYPNVAVGY